MDIHFKKILTFFLFVLSICICVVFTSCSDTMVEMPALYPRIIYSYESENASPDIVLSIFSEVSSDAVRLSSMTVQHNSSGLSWFVKPVTVLEDTKGKIYAGSDALKMPENEKFPEGLYTIIFRDYAGNTNLSSFKLEDTFLDHQPERAVSNKKFIVYDKNGKVIYISADKNETSDNAEKLSQKYSDADTIREYISDMRKKAVYILPEEKAGKEK